MLIVLYCPCHGVTWRVAGAERDDMAASDDDDDAEGEDLSFMWPFIQGMLQTFDQLLLARYRWFSIFLVSVSYSPWNRIHGNLQLFAGKELTEEVSDSFLLSGGKYMASN